MSSTMITPYATNGKIEGMTNLKLALAYGFLVWLIPFAVAFAIFPLHTADRIFFESIMPTVVVLATVIFSVLYARNTKSIPLEEWGKLGILWLTISIAIDLVMFSWGPQKMSVVGYLKDIGFTYLMIPTITAGFGYLKR